MPSSSVEPVSVLPPKPEAGSSDLARLVKERDWSQTPLGPVDTWPQSLRTVVQILLTSRYAMWMGWGDELTFLYNDAYRPTLGIKHPWALGSPATQVWAEIWRDIGPRIETVLSTGEATYDEGLLLFLERSGFPEETYHTFSYSPLNDDTGRVNGMLCVVTEETDRVIGGRRMATLRDLATGISAAGTEAQLLDTVSSQLSKNTKDLPFSLVYLFDSQGHARRASVTGLDDAHPLAAPSSESGSSFPWPLDSFQQPKAFLIEDLGSLSDASLPTGAWENSSGKAVVVPIRQQGSERSAGVLIVGLNPHRRYNEAYSGFVELVAGQIAAGLGSARAFEEERRRAEALAELDRAKTAFFSNVSHEFRTPLTLMLGPIEDLLAQPEESVGRETRDSLQVVHRSGLRLQRLVNTLLDFSRIEAGRAQASYEPVDLAAYTVDLASSFRSAMDRAGLQFSVDCPALPQPVYVDRAMWEKIVLNLVSNAFKYTLEGSVSVRLRADGDHALLTIQDTGPGIPQKELPRLFERFHRVEGTRGRTHEGSGIGLALVQELVRLHGGAVSVESTWGKGAVFSVSIPFGSAHLPSDRLEAGRTLDSTTLHPEAFVEEALRWLPEVEPAIEPVFPQPLASAIGPRSRVLLADDNADMRDYIRRLLGKDYEVIVTANGEEALQAALANPPDLVLTDVMMPVLDGFGLLAALRANEKTMTLPVLILSARAGEESRFEGLAAGADDYLVKPFTARELRARVEAHLALARMRKEAIQARLVSELRLSLALQATGLLAWQWDPIKDIVTTLGDATRIYGDDIGNSTEGYGLIHPEDQPAHRLKVEGCVRDGGSYNSDFRVQSSDKQSVTWLEERATAIPDEQGRVALVVGVTANVTARKQLEQELRSSKERLQQFLQQAPVAILVLRGRDHVIELANPPYQALIQKRDLIGRPFKQVVPEVPQEVLDAFDSVLDTGQPFVRNDFHIPYDQDGDGLIEDHWFNVVYHPLQEPDGSVSGLVAVCSEVTSQVVSRRELERVNKELEEFAYVASHDLQEPLRMVNIYTQQMLRLLPNEGDDELAQYATFVRQGIDRMRTLIADLLTFSRTVQRDELPTGRADLSASLAEAISVLQPRIQENSALICAGPMPAVRGDTAQLAHVFQNLLSNAIKYRRTDAIPEIQITAERQQDLWVISVRDNGIGFQQQFAERIFGLFKRLHKDEYPGTGLGLAICQRIVERYGGRIWAEGIPDEGAVFSFALQAADTQ